jgi:hypothetical protein
LITASVDREKKSIASAQNQCTLRGERVGWRVLWLCNRIASATSGKFAGGSQSTIGTAIEGCHCVFDLICQDENRARSEISIVPVWLGRGVGRGRWAGESVSNASIKKPATIVTIFICSRILPPLLHSTTAEKTARHSVKVRILFSSCL